MLRHVGFVVALRLLTATLALGQEIPPGTVLPMMASTTLDSAKSKPGDKFTGKLMQDVALPAGEKIRAGARIQGQVIESSGAGATTEARLVVRFDRLISRGKQTPINLSLRALASMKEV